MLKLQDAPALLSTAYAYLAACSWAKSLGKPQPSSVVQKCGAIPESVEESFVHWRQTRLHLPCGWTFSYHADQVQGS